MLADEIKAYAEEVLPKGYEAVVTDIGGGMFDFDIYNADVWVGRTFFVAEDLEGMKHPDAHVKETTKLLLKRKGIRAGDESRGTE